MRTVMALVAWLMAAAALTGCATGGNGTVRTLTGEQAARDIVIGTSNKADIGKRFGDATVTRFDNGYELWLYQVGVAKLVDSLPYVNLVLDSAENKKELAILFDRAGVVKKYQLMEAAP